VPRKKAASRRSMKSVVKAAALPNPNQLTLDFEGRAAEKQKTRARAKASPVRKAPAGLDIPKKPGD
jgi:hypothetical protein